MGEVIRGDRDEDWRALGGGAGQVNQRAEFGNTQEERFHKAIRRKEIFSRRRG